MLETINYEDHIDGTPVKFQYLKTSSNIPLSNFDLFYCDDKLLNRILSKRQLNTYSEIDK